MPARAGNCGWALNGLHPRDHNYTPLLCVPVSAPVGYSVPLKGFLFSSGGRRRLTMDLATPLEDVFVEDMTVRVGGGGAGAGDYGASCVCGGMAVRVGEEEPEARDGKPESGMRQVVGVEGMMASVPCVRGGHDCAGGWPDGGGKPEAREANSEAGLR